MAGAYQVFQLQASGIADVAFSPDYKKLYAVTRTGAVQVYDVATRELLATWTIGKALGGISVSEDGSYLLVALTEYVAGSATLYRIDTATGAIQEFTTSAEYPFRDIEIVDADTALVSSYHYGSVRKFNPQTGEFGALASGPFNYAVLVEDGRYTLLAQTGSSDGPLFLYDDQADSIIATGNNYQTYGTAGASGYNWGSQAISSKAGLVLQYVYHNTVNVFDLSLKFVRAVTVQGPVDGIAFNASGTHAYFFLIGKGTVAKYEVATWTLVEEFSVGTSNWHNDLGFGSQILIDPAERYITVLDSYAGSGELQLIDLTSRPAGFTGTPGSDTFEGDARDEMFWLHQGGDDSARGGGGRDTFYFGGAFTAGDTVDGGSETDQLVLQGDYAGAKAATLAAVTNVEQLLLLSGSNDMYGFPSANKYSYDLTTTQSTVQPGQYFYVLADDLKSGENLTFNGSAETDGGNFYIFAGHGTDMLTGGSGADIFLFRGGFTAADRVNGGAGEDRLVLRQNVSGSFEAATMTNVERLVLISGHDTNWGPNLGNLSYVITFHDGNVAAGQRLVVDASGLRAGEGAILHGGPETNGAFEMIGGAGNDILIGGTGNDIFYGGLGADVLQGGVGRETYVYRNVAESTRASRDQINGFGAGDTIDLTAIDANSKTAQHDQFSYIGASAFSGAAGELRVYQQDSRWVAEADVDGDGTADLSILISTENGYVPVAGSFLGVAPPAGGGDQVYIGTEGSDFINASQGGNDRFDLKGGNDGVYFGAAFSAADKVDGGAGRDFVILRGDYASAGPLQLAADTLKNVEAITFYSGSDAWHEPAGGQTRYFIVTHDANFAAGQRVSVSAGSLSAVEYLIFNGSPETDAAFDIVGGAGHDILIGGAGNDTFQGGRGADTLQGGLGNDTYVYSSVLDSTPGARDQINGLGSGDLIKLSAVDGNSTLSGRQEFRFIGDAAFSAAGQLRLFRQSGDMWIVQGDTNGDGVADLEIAVSAEPGYAPDLSNFRGVASHVGTSGDDVITGTDGPDAIYVHQGGNDVVNAGAGDDYIYLGNMFTAADRIDGGPGYDHLELLSGSLLDLQPDTIRNIEKISLSAGGMNITLHDSNVAAGQLLTIDASAAATGQGVRVNGSQEMDGRLHIYSGAGDDTLMGGQVGNVMSSGAGNDTLIGGAGNDVLTGGLGADLLQGAGGDDTYVYLDVNDSRVGARDQINGFGAGDKIDLSAIDANPSTPENDAFTFIGANPFSGQAGQLRAYQSDGKWLVEGDHDGDGVADLVILVGTEGGHSLGAGDFLL